MKRIWTAALVSVGAFVPAAAQCVPRPTAAFAGRVKIPYPSSGGLASVIRECGPEARRITQELIAEGKRQNTAVRWVEVYRVRRWESAFHDSIYQLRSQGFAQDSFRKFRLQGWNDAETLVYANKNGKYAGMIMKGTSTDGQSTLFALYGN